MSNPNKEALLIETLRVLKDGGAFSLLDHFCQDSIYGDFNETIAHLKAAGINAKVDIYEGMYLHRVYSHIYSMHIR